jgi:DNA primase
VAYVGRSLDGPPKYHLPAGFRKSLLLFNFHRAAAREEQTIVVVEGYFDCLKVHQAGFRCVVALMGTVLSGVAETLLLLAPFPQVILMLDGDDRGRQGSQRIAAQLAGRCSVRLVWMPDGKQPDQLSREEIRALLGPGLDDVMR